MVQPKTFRKEPYGHIFEIPIKVSILENFWINFLNF